MNLFKLNKNIEINKYCKSLHFQEHYHTILFVSKFTLHMQVDNRNVLVQLNKYV